MVLEIEGINVLKGQEDTPIIKEKSIIGTHRDGFQTMFQAGKGVSTGLSPVTISAQTYVNQSSKLKGYEITAQIFNMTGAQQTHNWQLNNDTQATEISAETGVVLENASYIIYTFLVPPEIITAGDLIKFRISAGTIGTDDAELWHGYISLWVNSLEETDELA